MRITIEILARASSTTTHASIHQKNNFLLEKILYHRYQNQYKQPAQWQQAKIFNKHRNISI